MRLLFSLALLSAPSMAQSQAISGLARAMDGDSLYVGEAEVRLFGIDAPEFDQTCKRDGETWACGAAAADALSKIVTGRDVRCVPVSVDEHRRTVARCSVKSIDINREMVRQGMAVAYRRYSSDFVATEDEAKAAKRGIWAGTFVMPEAYRHPPESRSGRSKATAPQKSYNRSRDWGNRADCVIKGNRNRRGQWIYHVPGMPYYEATRPEEIFCTEGEAQAAGYRRAVIR